MKRAFLVRLVLLSFIILAMTGVEKTAAAEKDWPAVLAAAMTTHPDTAWTNLNVAARLSPLIRFSTEACTTRRGPVPGSQAHVEAAMVLYADAGACNKATQLTTLQLYLHPITQKNLTTLIREITTKAGAPCFEGPLVASARGRAEPSHVTAWKLALYDIAIASQSHMPDAASLTVVGSAKVSDASSASARAAAKAFSDSVPPSCR